MRRYATRSAMSSCGQAAVKLGVTCIALFLVAVAVLSSKGKINLRGGRAQEDPVEHVLRPGIACDPEADAFGCPESPGHRGRRGCKHTGEVHSMSPDGQRGPFGALMISHDRETHASSLLALPDGDLLLTWFSGGDGQTEGGDGIAIVVSALRTQGGKSWTVPRVVSLEQGRSAQNPVLWWDAASKRVHLYHTSQVAYQGQGTSEVRHLVSADGGRSWSVPEAIFTEAGAFTRNQLLSGAGGEWMMPMYFTPDGYGGFHTHYSAVKISEDAGRTWSQHNMTAMGEWLAQPSVVQSPVKKTRLTAFFRDRRGRFIHSSTSDDCGRTWTKAQRSKLPSNNSGIQAVTLASGLLLVAFNNAQGGERWPLSVALSDDEGETWRWVRDVELGGYGERYGYPSVVQSLDGTVHLSYSYRRETIKYVAFTEDWVKAGSGSQGFFTGDL